MTVFRVFSDDEGTTHLERVALPEVLDGRAHSPRRVGWSEVAATSWSLSELVEPKPDNGLHAAPRRQLVAVLRGALEIETTAGDTQRLESGDCLIADDVDSAGHHTRQVGDEPLSTLVVGLTSEWLPSAE